MFAVREKTINRAADRLHLCGTGIARFFACCYQPSTALDKGEVDLDHRAPASDRMIVSDVKLLRGRRDLCYEEDILSSFVVMQQKGFHLVLFRHVLRTESCDGRGCKLFT